MVRPLARRTLLAGMGAGLACAPFRTTGASAPTDGNKPQFVTADAAWQTGYDAALRVLTDNVQVMPRYALPVLLEGSAYRGIWLECGPHEALVYRKFRPDIARQSHLCFFDLQRADGQLPCNNKLTESGFGQIQMVVPIAATSWELARATGDQELLETAYRSCTRWDAWLMRYRNTRKTGLIEGFCTYDTGHDNSPRWAGLPNQCPDKDARICPPVPSLPRLCPDLSATTYGGRLALAEMADALGRPDDAAHWHEKAAEIRALILSQLYVDDDAAFYDVDRQGHVVRIRCDILTRVCGEHVPDQALFDRLWDRQLHDPTAFWAPFPLPSVALNDPQFVRPIPRNSWGGASQALTALRASRWFDHYGRSAELAHLMQQWCTAILADSSFRQQVDPLTGMFTSEDPPFYTPTALLMMDFTWRLAGVTEEAESLHWNVRPGHPASRNARFILPADQSGHLAMSYDAQGADLSIAGKHFCRIENGIVRLVTTKAGVPVALTGLSPEPQHVVLILPGREARHDDIHANERIALEP